MTLSECLNRTEDFAEVHKKFGVVLVYKSSKKFSTDYWHLFDYAVETNSGEIIWLVPRVENLWC